MPPSVRIHGFDEVMGLRSFIKMGYGVFGKKCTAWARPDFKFGLCLTLRNYATVGLRLNRIEQQWLYCKLTLNAAAINAGMTVAAAIDIPPNSARKPLMGNEFIEALIAMVAKINVGM